MLVLAARSVAWPSADGQADMLSSRAGDGAPSILAGGTDSGGVRVETRVATRPTPLDRPVRLMACRIAGGHLPRR